MKLEFNYETFECWVEDKEETLRELFWKEHEDENLLDDEMVDFEQDNLIIWAEDYYRREVLNE